MQTNTTPFPFVYSYTNTYVTKLGTTLDFLVPLDFMYGKASQKCTAIPYHILNLM